ncbi:hypothetical protein GCM10007981_18590 [Thermocladium modestius]|uniref:Uncharacterized protein n=1 Tax=Thermocladium modestius TaxID=62609 RepID=A0A830GYG8_9CREN|nr:hypothetical protein [Thermocladium modestius]GGP22455.1 hypothetical protein GCM10007981_18590 [Thermocladium modestius]
MRTQTCAACGSGKTMAIIGGKPYCYGCASKVILMHNVKFLRNLKNEKLIPSQLQLPEV